MSTHLLAIDQGTTSSRAIIFTRFGEVASQHQIELAAHYPHPAWVEQDPEDMWNNTLLCCRMALQKANLAAEKIAAIGITNQRETTIIWDKTTGKSIYPAIVWQDRRTGDICQRYADHNINSTLQRKTGLLLDPYFSATKIIWILENVPQVNKLLKEEKLLFGTVDTFLLWKLTEGRVHATDATNASRTLLFNIHTQQWDDDILRSFNIPKSLLPAVLDSSADFGVTDPKFFGIGLPIASMIGDQQAATFGQACFKEGMVKSTYGTGCFMLLNTGSNCIQSQHRLLSTVAYRLKGKVTYGLEGSIFSSGIIIKWLRDTLKLIKTAAESEAIANELADTEGVYLVPAFTGLGAPYWEPSARAAIIGLTSGSTTAHIVRAGLEAIGYQSKDLLDAMVKESGMMLTTLRVDGGMAANAWLLQFLADMLDVKIQTPRFIETTALGAAYLAGLQIGIYQSLEEISELWQSQHSFQPRMDTLHRVELYAGWKNAVAKVLMN
jgi:glycerol kinase